MIDKIPGTIIRVFKTVTRRLSIHWTLSMALTVVAVLTVGHGQCAATPPLPDTLESGLNYLLKWCSPVQVNQRVDMARIGPVVAFIRQAPEMADFTPPDYDDTRGSFIALTVKRSLPEVIRYAYNRYIPEGAINPSSVNYSYWKEVDGGPENFPDLWKSLDDLTEPYIARGVAREAIAPDLHTGTYYAYDLQRAFLIYRRGTSRVVISLSYQLGSSDVGKKGFIVGSDQDWNYLYTQEKGLNKAGLGWVKSKIYNYYSVCCFIEDAARPGAVKIGVFQWLGAGWIGMNVVDSHHIRRGLKRYADQFKAMMESERLPEPQILERVCLSLEQTDERVLREKALDVTRHIIKKARADASLSEKKAIKELDEDSYVARMSKVQLVNTLMREYVKYCLGKDTPLKNSFWVALKDSTVEKRKAHS